jgi:hypothetical protein
VHTWGIRLVSDRRHAGGRREEVEKEKEFIEIILDKISFHFLALSAFPLFPLFLVCCFFLF